MSAMICIALTLAITGYALIVGFAWMICQASVD